MILNYFIGNHSSILDKTIYPGSRKFLQSDDPLRNDTAFHSAKPEEGTVNTRTMREEKAIARYQDNLQREMDETGYLFN